MTIAFKELAGSPVERYGPEGMRAERRLICAWDNRGALVEQLLGDGYEFGGSSRAGYPGTTGVVAMRAKVEPLAGDLVEQQLSELSEGLNAYHGFAKVTVDYELLVAAERSDLPAVEPGTFLTYRTEPGEETLVLPSSDLQWQGNPDATFPSDASGTLRLPVTRHRLAWHRVVNPPWNAIRQSAGTLNQSAFLGAAAGQLLFEAAAVEREFLRISELQHPELGWKVEYIFREKPLVTVAGQDGFLTTDFDPLLRFAVE